MNLISILANSSCESNSMRRLIALFGNLFNIIKILVPIILIVWGSIDLVRAMTAKDDTDIKKAQSTFVKRLIAAVAIFFVFPVVSFLMGLIGEKMSDNQQCMNCFLYPNDNNKCYYTTKFQNETAADPDKIINDINNPDCLLSECSEQ